MFLEILIANALVVPIIGFYIKQGYSLIAPFVD